MNFIKRSLLSVWKHKVKNLVLLIVFAVITALAYIGICIPSAAKLEGDRAKATVGAEATVYLNDKKAYDFAQKNPGVDISYLDSAQITKLLNLKHIQSSNYVIDYIAVVSDGFDMIGNETLREKSQADGRASSSILAKKKYIEPDIHIYGATDVSKVDQFLSGGYSLYSGRFVSSSDAGKKVVMISKDVADKNKLRIGARIKIKECFERSTPIEFTVVGLFKAPPVDSTIAQYFMSNPVNYVFMPYDQVGLFNKHDDNKPIDTTKSVRTALFFLNDPSNVTDFIKQAKSIIPVYYDVQSNNDLYNQAVAPLESVSKTTQMLELLIILAGCIIISLIIAIFLRGRNYEYGVLLAIGEKRLKIVGQTILEVIIPVALAFCIGIAAGTLASKQIGSAMLNTEIKTEQQQNQDNQTSTTSVNPYIVEGGDIEKALNAVPIQSIDISLTPAECGWLALASLLIVLVSVIIPCVSILRYQPRRILAARK